MTTHDYIAGLVMKLSINETANFSFPAMAIAFFFYGLFSPIVYFSTEHFFFFLKSTSERIVFSCNYRSY